MAIERCIAKLQRAKIVCDVSAVATPPRLRQPSCGNVRCRLVLFFCAGDFINDTRSSNWL